ncbi:hypothetical protein ACQEVB_20325 [Pseudonocardia sp. CA-107938]|uniref:hypothetical protein n=1 Tax=Pseudonocardia sp. CA-107938 TaxID=3240021 RepID=UPI003D947419
MRARLWTRPLQVLTAACGLVFALGTAAQTWLIITEETVGRAMALAGRTPAEIAAGAPELVATLRIVGVAFLVANLLLLAAVRGGAWTFWLALAVTVGQALGVVAGMVPWVVLQATYERFGPLGLLPTLVTDGGSAVLAVLLLISLTRSGARVASRSRSRG